MALDQQLIYRLVKVIKTHFECKSYDAFKYRFKLRGKNDLVHCDRADIYTIAKLQKLYRDKTSLIEHLVANFANSNLIAERLWIGELASEGAIARYRDWKAVTDSMSYVFQRDLISMRASKPVLSFDTLLSSSSIFYPVPAIRFTTGDMRLETLCALNMMTGFLDDANLKIAETIRWPLFYLRVKKYEPFLKALGIVDKAEMAKIVYEVFS